MHLPRDDVALYVADGRRFIPTDRGQGPWSPGHLFGGVPAALFAQVLERTPTLVPMQVARLTVDLLRPVPMRPAEVTFRVVREGKRIQVLEASMVVEEIEVARASALRLRTIDLADLDLPGGIAPPPPEGFPIQDHQGPTTDGSRPGMADSVDYAYAEEIFDGPTWVRLRVPVLASEDTAPLARVAFAADFVSGVGHPRQLPVTGINADITVNLIRYPVGAWLCIGGSGWTGPGGVGLAQATLSDGHGVVAAVAVSRLVERLD
jgi:hypothetical protein